jgi:hypothetical protein
LRAQPRRCASARRPGASPAPRNLKRSAPDRDDASLRAGLDRDPGPSAAQAEQRKPEARDHRRASSFKFEAVRATKTYDAYNPSPSQPGSCTTCTMTRECTVTCCHGLCLCLGLRLVGSEQHGTGSEKGVAAGRQPPGGPVRWTRKNRKP